MLQRLTIAVRWDFLRQWRYNIIATAVLVTLFYILILFGLSLQEQQTFLILLVFNDPVILGMIFIGALYLFERSENTLPALRVTPLLPAQYLWSKAITLTSIATASALVLVLLSYGWRFHYGYFIAGVVLTTLFFTFLGFGLVINVRSFNDYLIRVAGVMIPAALPVLNLFDITDTLWFYPIPSQAGMILMEAGFESQPVWKIVYALVYLAGWNAWAFRWSLRRFESSGS